MGKVFLNKKELLKNFCDRFLEHKIFKLKFSRRKKTLVIYDRKNSYYSNFERFYKIKIKDEHTKGEKWINNFQFNMVNGI